LWVTGRLGGSQGRREFLFEPRLKEGSWLAQHKLATAMMDLSDGLAMDLPRLAARSGISFQLEEESLPRHKHCTVQQALGDGEDFELLFTSRRRDRERLKKLWPFPCRLSRIGVILPASEKSTIFHHAHGFDHFKLG
jgi:thiamine-monophosphate kinase